MFLLFIKTKIRFFPSTIPVSDTGQNLQSSFCAGSVEGSMWFEQFDSNQAGFFQVTESFIQIPAMRYDPSTTARQGNTERKHRGNLAQSKTHVEMYPLHLSSSTVLGHLNRLGDCFKASIDRKTDYSNQSLIRVCDNYSKRNFKKC